MINIVWFRRDLRLGDNPALTHAAALGDVLPVFILEETEEDDHRYAGTAQAWWLHHSLKALSASLPGLRLFRGKPDDILTALARETGAEGIFWNRRYEPKAIKRDASTKQHLIDQGLEAQSFAASLLAEPWTVKNGSGLPFKVFTPFWRSLSGGAFPTPIPAPGNLEVFSDDRVSALAASGEDELDYWGLCPKKPDWASGWPELWSPGEAGARSRLDAFLQEGLKGYHKLRDRPDRTNVSRLSPHLHFGEISPAQIAQRVAFASEADASLDRDAAKFMSEIGWREFAHHLLFYFPDLDRENWKKTFDHYPWQSSDAALKDWQKGRTGYPIVDAGMRELWQTGFMHNRVRMVVASFLIKHLRIDWREGAKWFLETLLDADLANNSAGWQWVAGSGADAAPYFRIFNPITQGRKFDPAGAYVRKWCPELAALETDYIHAPFEAPSDVLARAGIVLGESYPAPIVDHKAARQAALQGYERVKEAAELG